MKTIDVDQQTKLAMLGLNLSSLVRLQTYTDRDAETVDNTYYFALQWCEYDYGNTGTNRQFEPLLHSIGITTEEMPHLPDPLAALSGALAKKCTLVLLNRERETGNRLIYDLRQDNLEGATVEWAELMLGHGDTWADLTSYTGDEHTVRYRGELTRVVEITDETIELEFTTDVPRIPWIVASDATKNDPRDVGRRLPIVYGESVRVQAVGWEVGQRTTLAEDITDTQTGAINFTDTSAFPSTGTIAIGTEQIAYTANANNQLTLGTRGASSTTAAAHKAGDITIEMIATATWVLAAHEVQAIDDVFIENPYNQEIVRVTDAFTKTANDTTTISGKTCATISFTQAQIQTLLETLAAQAGVDQQPARSTNAVVSHPLIYELVEQQPSGYRSRIGFTTTQCDDIMGNTTTMQTGSPGDSAIFDFDDPGGEVLSQDVHITWGAVTAQPDIDMEIRKNTSGGTLIMTHPGPSSGSSAHYETGAITSSPDFNAVWVGIMNGTASNAIMGYLHRVNVIVSADAPEVDTQPEVAETSGTEVKITAASVGYGLRFYANVDGMKAPSASYLCGSGNLITEMPDVLRHLLTSLCVPNQSVESSWNDAGNATHLDDNAHATDIRNLGSQLPDILQTLAYESRANLTCEERLTSREWRMLVAENDYDWGASVQTLTDWQAFTELGRDLSTLYTRFRGLYAWRPEFGGGPEAFAQVVRIDEDQNDVTTPSTVDLQNAEAAYGRRDMGAILLRTVQDEATAKEIMGYYAHERIRVIRLFRIQGVPWAEGFDLERGDIVTATPPWETSGRKMRVLDYIKDPTTQLVDLVTVEVG